MKTIRQPTKMKRFLKENPGILFGYVNDYFVNTKEIDKYNLNILKKDMTETQIKIYKIAKESGYFDYPRKISLIKLSTKLEIAQSTLCLHLQKIINKIVIGVEI